MSEVKVNKISPRTNCGTVTLGDSGDTFSIPAGVTLTNSGTATGFGPTGAVSWDTTPKTTTVTAASGIGYFINTTSGAVTVDLPAGSAGSIVAISDYANTAATNKITIDPNGTDKINGVNQNAEITTNGVAVTLIYVDSTIGWKDVNDSTLDVTGIPPFVAATGGTETTCGDYKIHTFTGPGTFTVTNAGTPAGSDTVDYLVIAAGGGGGQGSPPAFASGGGGAGGARMSSGVASGCYTASPLGSGVSALPVSVQGYPISIGGGGAGSTSTSSAGASGTNSVFSTITSAGGGGGGSNGANGVSGGSGGGSGQGDNGFPNGGAGNTPPTSPSQGNAGGNFTTPGYSGGGGGGATQAGFTNTFPAAGNGGDGVTNSISGSPVAYAGGGGAGGSDFAITTTAGAGGAGGGGAGGAPSVPRVGNPGTVNTGGGAGGGGRASSGGAGGSGIVVIRYKFQ